MSFRRRRSEVDGRDWIYGCDGTRGRRQWRQFEGSGGGDLGTPELVVMMKVHSGALIDACGCAIAVDELNW